MMLPDLCQALLHAGAMTESQRSRAIRCVNMLQHWSVSLRHTFSPVCHQAMMFEKLLMTASDAGYVPERMERIRPGAHHPMR